MRSEIYALVGKLAKPSDLGSEDFEGSTPSQRTILKDSYSNQNSSINEKTCYPVFLKRPRDESGSRQGDSLFIIRYVSYLT